MADRRESLFAIDARIRSLLDRHMDGETGELDPQFDAEFEALGLKREAKLLAYGHVYRWLRFEAEKIKANAKPFEDEARHLRRRAQAKENAAERLKDRAEAFMTVGEKLEDDLVRLSWRQSTRVLLAPGLDENALPAQYRRSEASKSALKKGAEAGQSMPKGVTIETRKRLSIT
jgi:hypothetical protein